MYFNLARTAILVLVVCACAAHASPATIAVSSRGLDLNTRAGAREMLIQIQRAASTVCGGDPWKDRYTSDTPVRLREYQKCMTETVSQAVSSLRAPLVHQFYAATIIRQPAYRF